MIFNYLHIFIYGLLPCFTVGFCGILWDNVGKHPKNGLTGKLSHNIPHLKTAKQLIINYLANCGTVGLILLLFSVAIKRPVL